MEESYVKISSSATTYAGPDATNFYRAATLRGSLKLYAECKIIPTRGVTITKMLAMATKYTGKKYKRGEALKAANDISKWIDAMRSALPIIREI